MPFKPHIWCHIYLIVCCLSLFGASKAHPQQPDEILPETPCNDLQYYSDNSHYRATGSGRHHDFRTAERIARLDAGANLAIHISVHVQSVSMQYVLEYRNNHHHEISTINTAITQLISEQQLKNILVICNESDFANQQHIVYVAVEVPRMSVYEEMIRELNGGTPGKYDTETQTIESIILESIQSLKNKEQQ